jgi:hypothetical protein
MNLELHLRLAGALQIVLAAVHLTFSERFQWKEELARLSLLNRQIFLVHTFFVCLMLTLMGALCLFFPETLVENTRLARLVLTGFVAFWALRLVFQWCVYDRSLWRGNAFNTRAHLAFTALWLYFVAVYAVALFGRD